MSSYHSSFSYHGENSWKDKNLIVVSFEPDEGFTDSFLAIDNISDDYYDGTKRYNYGSKYNSSAEIQITVIKRDGSDMKLKDFRSCAKWLTGARTDSWLDLYEGEDIVYSFLGKFTNLEQYKLDARTVGLRLTFSSISPWAYSVPQVFDCTIGQSLVLKDTTYEIATYDLVETECSSQTISYRNVNHTSNISDMSWDTVSYADSIDYRDGSIKLVNPTSFVLEKATNETRIMGKYIKTTYDNKYYYIPSDAKLTYSKTSTYVPDEYIKASRAIRLTLQKVTTTAEGKVLCKTEDDSSNFGFDDGILTLNRFDSNNNFSINNAGIVYLDTSYNTQIDNKSDDLYTYIYLDIYYENGKGDKFYVTNKTLNEETIVTGLNENEKISISAKQFIVSESEPNKIFGDDFNFVWPRLAPGINELNIYGAGSGRAQFTYRYPMKVGDCTMDISTYGGGIDCGNCDEPASYDTVRWKDIIGTPTTIGGYGITDAYTDKEVDEIIENIEITGGGGGSGSVNIDEEKLNQMLSEVLQ